MITFSKIDSSTFDSLKRRILKFLQFGVKTSFESSPFGVDSSPIKGMTAIYSPTSNNSEDVILGYINKNQLAESGETRLFSLDANGNLKSYLWLKKDGSLELNGDGFSAVRFENLKTALDNMVTGINTENTKIQTAITTLGGTYARADISINLSSSESPDVKIK